MIIAIRLESDFLALVMYGGEINFLMQDVCAHVQMGGAYGYYSSCSRQSDHLGLSITMLLANRRYINIFYICAINIKSLDKQLKFHWNAM